MPPNNRDNEKDCMTSKEKLYIRRCNTSNKEKGPNKEHTCTHMKNKTI